MEIQLTNTTLSWILIFTTIASAAIVFSWLLKQDRITGLDMLLLILVSAIPPLNMVVVFAWAVVIPIMHLGFFLNDFVVFRKKN